MIRHRIPYLDNAKGVLILFVVVGHVLEVFMNSSSNHTPVTHAIYTFIYIFHMPAFIAIAGYLSGKPRTEISIRRDINTLLIPYLIFELAITSLRLPITGTTNLDLLNPSRGLWFLLALFMMRVISPYFSLLKFPVLISLAISIAVGYFPGIGAPLSLGRFFALLPFYFIGVAIYQKGYTSKISEFTVKRIVQLRIFAVICLSTLLLLLLTFRETIFRYKVWRIFYYKDSAIVLDLENHFYWIRPAALLISALAAIAVLLLIPRKNSFLETWGINSLNIYLLHIVVFNILFWVDLPDLPLLGVLGIAVLLGSLLTAVIGTKTVDKLVRPIMRGNHDWLYSKKL